MFYTCNFMKFFKPLLFLPVLILGAAIPAVASPQSVEDVESFVQDRIKTVVAFEFFLETEMDRREGDGYALIVDDRGTCVVLESLIPAWAPAERLKGFKAYALPDDGEEYELEYLGQDYLSNWHVLRFKDGLPEGFKPITNYAFADVHMGDPVIGIGSMSKELGFDPFVLSAQVALVKGMPDDQAILRDEICNPGCPVFNHAGEFVGWGLDSMARNEIMNVRHPASDSAQSRGDFGLSDGEGVQVLPGSPVRTSGGSGASLDWCGRHAAH